MVAEASAVATETAREVSQYAWASASLLADAVCNRTATAADASASAIALPASLLGNWSSLVVAAACEDDAELLRDGLIAAAVLFVLLCACCCYCCRRHRHNIRSVRPRARRGATRMVNDDDGDDGDWEAAAPSTRTRSQGRRSVQPAVKGQRGGGDVRPARAADDEFEEASALTVRVLGRAGRGRRRERGASPSMEMQHRVPSRQLHASVLD